MTLQELSPSQIYRIPDNIVSFELDDVISNPEIKAVMIPAGLSAIADGSLSNAGSWVDENRGVVLVHVEDGNRKFFTGENFLYERLDDESLKIVLYFGEDEKIIIKKNVSLIAADAFKGARFSEVYFEKKDAHRQHF